MQTSMGSAHSDHCFFLRKESQEKREFVWPSLAFHQIANLHVEKTDLHPACSTSHEISPTITLFKSYKVEMVKKLYAFTVETYLLVAR